MVSEGVRAEAIIERAPPHVFSSHAKKVRGRVGQHMGNRGWGGGAEIFDNIFLIFVASE